MATEELKELSGFDILMVEDESWFRKQIASQLQKLGAEVTGVSDLRTARKQLSESTFDLVLLDVDLPDGKGPSLLKDKVFPPDTTVIVITGKANVEDAVECMRLGAVDYLSKDNSSAELPLVIARAKKTRQAARVREHHRATDSSETLVFGPALVGMKEQIKRILEADQRIQENLPPVLIEGETGTGKTASARWIHHHGPRADAPLIEVNCPAVPETLAESELFGHERGAFTDARAARVGLFEAANGGTLFLDELPSLSLPIQAKVLKAIEDRRIRRLGGTREIPIDARVIAATNRNLRQLVQAGEFREDLLHRLDLYRVRIPPLREWGKDILELAQIFITRVSQRHRLPCKEISAVGRQRLLSARWPGNVRELSHEIERAIVFESSEKLEFAHLAGSEGLSAPEGQSWLNPDFRFSEQGFDLEKAIGVLIERALRQTGENVSAAARLLGVTRDYLRYRLAEQKVSGESGGNGTDKPEGGSS